MSQSPAAFQLFKQQGQFRKRDAHATHDVHDLAVFRLQLFLLQLLEPGLLFYGSVTIPFVDRFPRGEIYDLLTTKPEDAANGKQTE